VVPERRLPANGKARFREDVTGALKPAANALEIGVTNTNLWVNRLIGDEQPAAKKYKLTTQQFYRADSPVLWRR
jgi:hypothetical protein